MNIEISKEKSNAISIVRITAMASIVLCHIFQAYDNPLAWRFNVGVQVFLVLSGYLYGHKDIEKWGLWYWNRFKKLYIPCFIYCLVALTLLHKKRGIEISLYNYLSISAMDGINHLWFMKAILLCYLITPILSYLRKWPLFVAIMLMGAGIAEFGYFRFRYDEFSWLWLYSLGYIFPSLKRYYKWIIATIILLLAISISISRHYYQTRILADLWHYSWGFSICILGINGLKHITDNKRIPEVLYKIDPYSFHIYITHHIFLIGPLAIVPFMPNAFLTVVCVISLTAISSYLLKLISDFIIKRL